MSVVRRARDGRIVVVPDLGRVRAMRRRAVPTNNHPAGTKLPTTNNNAPVSSISDYQETRGEPADISEDDSWPLDNTGDEDGADNGPCLECSPGEDTATDPDDESNDDTAPEPAPDTEPTVVPQPRGNASKEAWIDYAMAVNIAVDINATRNDIRDYVLDRMSQPALAEGGRLERPEDEPVTREGGRNGTTDPSQA